MCVCVREVEREREREREESGGRKDLIEKRERVVVATICGENLLKNGDARKLIQWKKKIKNKKKRNIISS